MKLTDKEIILKIKNGEIDYYSFIVGEYTNSIYRYIKTKIKKHEDVEDLVQNVFTSFYRAIERFDEEKPIKPYLYQIVKNELKMFYRSRKPVLPLKEEIYISDDNNLEIEDKESYLKLLSNQEKEIFIYIDEGYNYEEISRKINKPLNTVKSIIRRARVKLRIKNQE
ncbi:MAG: RNA polymerase, sigma-24 subunit, ECF subfamily [Candidatus Roizmanbacteria bacterium GW2011_GWC2_37_13]|uniref:RNA polymerase sigma factor SigS n=1 Tax=Candidatus Roizmanbacteria bacterium GW2011_GWC2_37_13 TaxID=1618486 RepID=A0A0G0IMU0_9BACT|nr:MAG: RNA polymerase, sigma-24 subunit, ECF subfamily [Candidatus Roizmanbacteria bacterium GW2011_GWC1_37_12]KKQ25524.1 MAG: RNA polymerase, sigma-24 subunit, ECF subfamily [Candidatus Roizmanbacteria bacterium GW2011_GWC2_37_13]